MARAGVPAGIASITHIGNAIYTPNQTGGGTRPFSVTHTCNSSYTYVICVSFSSSTSDYNSITGCTVNGVTATEAVLIGTATSYVSPNDRTSAAIYYVSGISGSSIDADITWSGSDVFRSGIEVYELDGVATLDDTASDQGEITDTTGQVLIDVDPAGFVVAFAGGLSMNAGAVSFDGDVTVDDALAIESFFGIVCGSKAGGGISYQIDGLNLTGGNSSNSFKMVAASFV
tara:strand:- start:343 stop:1032 length:690 start_codon:yes stop_codon:yes gene_type:complete